jgi:hypothetical protein
MNLNEIPDELMKEKNEREEHSLTNRLVNRSPSLQRLANFTHAVMSMKKALESGAE